MSKQSQFDSVKILGVGVDTVTMPEAIEYICAKAADPKSPAGYVIKPYVEFLDRASVQPELQDILNDAELSIADGIALLWAAHYLYAGPHGLFRFVRTLFSIPLKPDGLSWPLPERAAGTNFTWPLLEAAASAKLKVYLIGKPTSEEIAAVARVINQKIPELQIFGTQPGYDQAAKRGAVTDEWISHTAGQIKSSAADIVLVGMGFPLQEKVCAKLTQHLTRGVLVGEGGTFDYESFGGSRRKAPAGWQRFGLEWLWRLVQEPGRVGRQLAIPRFIYKIWQSR